MKISEFVKERRRTHPDECDHCLECVDLFGQECFWCKQRLFRLGLGPDPNAINNKNEINKKGGWFGLFS